MTARRVPGGEALPPVASGAPFDLEGGPDSVLFLHGLTGTPYEVLPVALRLHRSGLRCRGPLMAGHGAGPRELAQTTWTDWVDGARRELELLRGSGRTFVVGCSMGALVACALAHEPQREIAGLALLAPALELAGLARVVGLLARALPFGRELPPIPKLGGSDVRDRAARRENPTMPGVPLSAVGELVRLARHVDALLPEVRVPALVVAGAHDHTVARSGVRRLAARIGGGPARVVVLPRSFHLVGIDVDRERCAEAVATFFHGLRAPSGSAKQGDAWQARM